MAATHGIATAVGTLVGWHLAYDKEDQYALKLVQDASSYSFDEFSRRHPKQRVFYDTICSLIASNKTFNKNHNNTLDRMEQFEAENSRLVSELENSNQNLTNIQHNIDDLKTRITTVAEYIFMFCGGHRYLNQNYPTIQVINELSPSGRETLLKDILMCVVFSGSNNIEFTKTDNIFSTPTLESIHKVILSIEDSKITRKLVFSKN